VGWWGWSVGWSVLTPDGVLDSRLQAHKLETSEVLYENLVFANNGHGPGCGGGCGGIAILNFNDYDNTFDGCHFTDNSNGITTDKMANIYVRNSRCRYNLHPPK